MSDTMSPKQYVQWHCNVGYDGDIYLKEKIEIDKFIFHKKEYHDLWKEYKELIEKKEGAIFPNFEDGFFVACEVISLDKETQKDESEKKLREFLNLITLQTNCTFRLGPYQIEKEVRGVDPALSRHYSLSKTMVEKAFDVKKIIDDLDKEKKDLTLQALDWYHRGTDQEDIISSFANYWIGFELLSYWFGEGEPNTCLNCGVELPHSKIRGRLKKFVTELELPSDDVEKILDLYEFRNKLFHRAKPLSVEEKIEIRKLLKKCILACLGLNEYECREASFLYDCKIVSIAPDP